MERAAAITDVSEKTLERAFVNRDDISLLNALQAIMKVQDVTAAYILDADGQVVSHTDTGAWGKRFRDDLSTNAVKAGGPLLQRSGDAEGWVYSHPIASSGTLCIGFSPQRSDAALRHERTMFIYSYLIILFVSSLALAALYRFAVRRAARFEAALSALVALPETGRISLEGSDEFSRLAGLVNQLMERAGTGNASSAATMDDTMIPLMKEVAALSTAGGILIADRVHRVLYAGEDAKRFFGMDDGEVTGMHLLDSVKDPAVLSLLKGAGETPGSWKETSLEGMSVRALTVRGAAEGNPAGTIILLRHL